MKTLALLFTLFLVVAQGCSKESNPLHPGDPNGPVDPNGPLVRWEVRRTDVSHTLLVLQVIAPTIEGAPLAMGDYIGVFFTNERGEEICGGYGEWQGDNLTIAAWNNDSTSEGKDGFNAGEAFNWKIGRAADGKVFNARAEYASGSSTFTANGMSTLSALWVD